MVIWSKGASWAELQAFIAGPHAEALRERTRLTADNVRLTHELQELEQGMV